MAGGVDRRAFLSTGSAAMVCTIAGRRTTLRTPEDVQRADRAVAAIKKPAGAAKDPVDALRFGTPQPQPGGQVRRYWIEAATTHWDVAPTGRDEWMNMAIRKPTTFRAFAYREWTEGFAAPKGPPTIPGPTLHATVGDVIRVTFRNGDEVLNQPVTMHPHGVRYTPDYDGTYLGDYTRVGGFVAPGEEFTYTWEATPDSVGVWPYHDHGPGHTLNTFRGLFGALIIRRPEDPVPDVETVLYQHSFPPQVTGLSRLFQCFNGKMGAGNTPTVRAKVGQDVAWHVIGGDNMFHTFHVHGHRWKDPAGQFVDNPGFGPHEPITARYVEDNPGRWLYHCHVFSHQDGGMAGWYLVDP